MVGIYFLGPLTNFEDYGNIQRNTVRQVKIKRLRRKACGNEEVHIIKK